MSNAITRGRADIEMWFDNTSDPEKPMWVTENHAGNTSFHRSRTTALAAARKLARKSGGRVIELGQFGGLSDVTR